MDVESASSADKYQIICCPVGYGQIIEDIKTEELDVLKWDVRLKESGGDEDVITETRTYYLDPINRLDTVYLYYFNSFSQICSLRSFGGKSKRFDVSGQKFRKHINEQSERKDFELGKFGSQKTDSLKLASSYLRSDQMAHLAELFMSEEVYIIENGEYLPVRVENVGTDYSKSRESLFAVELLVTKSRTNKRHSV